jgi:multidrug efflux system outer membrane protein
VNPSPQPVRRNKDALSRNVPTSVSTGIPSALLENRPDVREAEWLVQAAKCDLRAAHAAFFPSLAVTVGVGLQAFNPKYLLFAPESLFYSASLGLLAPLVNRSAIEAEFDVAKASQIQAMYLYQKVVLNAYVEVANGLSRLVSSSQAVELRKAQKTALERTVETADILYRAGKASYFEVLLAQKNTLSADLDLIDAMKNQQVASIVIYKALGGGW